ncbi:MAG: hypothetical protein KDI46_04625 [Alphaproteobacteria bacterium]|nr:hypothetical protein [Alphaproteobacteria bacterium]
MAAIEGQGSTAIRRQFGKVVGVIRSKGPRIGSVAWKKEKFGGHFERHSTVDCQGITVEAEDGTTFKTGNNIGAKEGDRVSWQVNDGQRCALIRDLRCERAD